MYAKHLKQSILFQEIVLYAQSNWKWKKIENGKEYLVSVIVKIRSNLVYK